MKYFVFSIDDGTIYDEKVIGVFNKYGIKATFNLNSGLQSFVWYKDDKPVRRLNINEYKHLYDNHEIASHSLTHPHMTMCSDDGIIKESKEDISNLSQIFDRKVEVFAFPFHDYDERTIELVKNNTPAKVIRVSREDESFKFPSDPYHVGITSYKIDHAFGLFDKFIKDKEAELFVFVAHAYDFEFDWGYEKLELLCQKVLAQKNIKIIPMSALADLINKK